MDHHKHSHNHSHHDATLMHPENFLFFLPLSYGVFVAAMMSFLAGILVTLLGISSSSELTCLAKTSGEYWSGLIAIAVGIYRIFLAVLLVVGVYLEQYQYLLPWLVITIFEFLHAVWHLFTSSSFRSYRTFLDLAIVAYMWIIVYSYYLHLQKNVKAETEKSIHSEDMCHHHHLSYISQWLTL